MESARKSKKITRLKTGCRTCRIRRVKCDETPGACRRCTSTGRKCDSYDINRLPTRRALHASQTLDQYRLRSNWAGKTSDERRCLSYFQYLTVPMMNCWFDHRLWDTLIPQLAQAEPAVCHAVVAFSTLQEALDSAARGAGVVPTVLLEDMTNRHQRFAVEQYNRSIAQLNSRISSNDPAVKNTVLICCFLYVLFELLRGKYDRAFTHLRRGVAILKNHENTRIEDSIATAMTHLDLQGAHFGVSQLHDRIALSELETWHRDEDFNVDFQTLPEAWLIRNKLFHDFCVFHSFCDKLTREQFADNFALLCAKKRKHKAQVLVFQGALDRFEATANRQGTITKKKQRAIDVMRMHVALSSILVEVTILHSAPLVREKYRDRFIEIVEHAERIVSNLLEGDNDDDDDQKYSYKDKREKRRPRFMMEVGIITPLYFVCEKSGDMAIIQRATRVIQSWPHREGLWDSELMLTLLHGMMTVLNERKGEPV